MIKNILIATLTCLPLWCAVAAPAADKININTADTEVLARELKGVGPAKAKTIVMDREKNGKFQTIDDLARVRGISPAFVESNRDRLITE